MQLIFVSGPEATGKSAIAKELAQKLGYSYLSKDVIKESLFDTEPHNTWDFSWYEQKAKSIFFDQIRAIVSSQTSAVIESNFDPTDKTTLISILESNPSETREIFCTTRGFTSLHRFVKRNESGRRHKGHHDRRWYLKVFWQDFVRLFGVNWHYKPLGLSSEVIGVDSTEFSNISIDEIIRQLTSQ